MTYKEISAKYKIPITTLYRRAHVLRLEGKFKGVNITFNKNQISQLVNYVPVIFPESKKTQNHVRKIAIIEFYLKFGGVNRVSRMLNIPRAAVGKAVKEYEETGCITVTSKLNTMEPFEENGNYINE